MPTSRCLLLLGWVVLANPLTAQPSGYVMNEAPRLPAARAWRAGPVLMQAGHAEDPNGLELSRVVGAVRTRDGRVVIGNAGANELVVVDANGRPIARAGRGGEGPGEFRSLSRIGITPEGEIWAADRIQRLIHLFGSTAEFSRTISLKSFTTPGGLHPAGVMTDGRFVLYSAAIPLGGPAAQFDSTDIVLLDPRNGESITIARVPQTDVGDPLGSKLFGAPLILAVGATEIWRGFGDQYRVHRMDGTGRVRGGLDKRQPAVPLNASVWTRYLDARAAASRAAGRSAEELEQMRQRLEGTTRPSQLPFYSDAMVDLSGNLWVRGFEVPDVITPDWDVFDSAGNWLTTLPLPERFRPMQIGPDWILGVQRDEDGVESVVLRRLTKPN